MIDWSSTASSETLCRNPRAKSGDVNKKQVKEKNRRQRQDKIRIQQRRINCKSIFVQLPNTARRPFLGHSQRERDVKGAPHSARSEQRRARAGKEDQN